MGEKERDEKKEAIGRGGNMCKVRERNRRGGRRKERKKEMRRWMVRGKEERE